MTELRKALFQSRKEECSEYDSYTWYIAGNGIRLKSGFRSIRTAMADIDFQLDYNRIE